MNKNKFNLLLLAFLTFASVKAQPPGWTVEEASPDHFFRENIGQLHDGNGGAVTDVLFYSGDATAQIFIMDQGRVAHLQRNTLTRWSCMITVSTVCNSEQQFCGNISSFGLSDETTNYYDAHIPDGILGVRNYGGVVHQGAFDNINIIYASTEHGVATYFEVEPGGNAGDIRLKFEGHSTLEAVSDGPLIASTPYNTFAFNQLQAYQLDANGVLVPLGWGPSWGFGGTDEIILENMSNYDPNLTLYLVDVPPPPPAPAATVIPNGSSDWSTRYGGGENKYPNPTTTKFSHEEGGTIRIDKVTKHIYHTMSRPKDNWLSVTPGCEQAENAGGYDIFITKFEANTYKRIWATYFGGAGDEHCRKMALSNNQNSDFIYLTGWVKGGNLPMPSTNQGTFVQGSNHGEKDAFVASFDKTAGARQWVTHFGGSKDDEGMSIFVDDIDHKLYITGYSTKSPVSTVCNTPASGAFPLCSGGSRYFQNSYGNSGAYEMQGFVAEFDIDQNNNYLEWSTLFGGNADEISFDVLKVNSGGTKAVYITGLTRSDNLATSYPSPITSPALSGDFPFANPGNCYFQYTNNTAGDDEGFIAKFNSNYELVWSTQFGGAPTGGLQDEHFSALALNKDNLDVYAVGLTSTRNLGSNNCVAVNDAWWPVCTNGSSIAYSQNQLSGLTDPHFHIGDVLITRFSPAGALKWSTYFGGGAVERYFHDYEPQEMRVSALVDDVQNLYIYGTSTWRKGDGVNVHHMVSPVSTPTKNVPNGIHGNYYNQANNASQSGSEVYNLTYFSDAFLAAFNQHNKFAYGTYFGGWSQMTDPNVAVIGQGSEIGTDFDIHGHQAIYLTGRQSSYGTPEQKPASPGYFAPFDRTPGDWNCFITRLKVESWWQTTGIRPDDPNKDKDVAIVSPNPMAEGTATAMVEVETETPAEVNVAIYDMLGREYYNGKFTLAKGINNLTLDVSNANMAAGMYTIKITGSEVNKSVMLMVVK